MAHERDQHIDDAVQDGDGSFAHQIVEQRDADMEALSHSRGGGEEDVPDHQQQRGLLGP